MGKTGVIYILTNLLFPKYVIIGYANNIDKRLQQFNRSDTDGKREMMICP